MHVCQYYKFFTKPTTVLQVIGQCRLIVPAGSSINSRLIIDNANLPAYPSLLAISRIVKCARRRVSNAD